MSKISRLSTTILLVAVAGFTASSANAFIDPEDWKMDKWGGWDKWDGPPDAQEWRRENWNDMDQWGPGGWQTPWGTQPGWGGRGGNMPWGGGNRGGWGGMPWSGDRGNWGGMPWGGNRGGWGGMPWGGNNRGWGGNQGWRQPYDHAPQPGYRTAPQQQPAIDMKDRYPKRSKTGEATAPAETAPVDAAAE